MNAILLSTTQTHTDPTLYYLGCITSDKGPEQSDSLETYNFSVRPLREEYNLSVVDTIIMAGL